jgi:hypothetical protein
LKHAAERERGDARRFEPAGALAEVFDSGPVFDHVAQTIWDREGRDVPILGVVKVRIFEAKEVVSPAYWIRKGVTVDEVRRVWAGRYGYAILPK